MSSNPLRPYRVLTIDGGGMRGLYTAALLNKLAELFKTQCAPSGSGPGGGGQDLDIGSAFDLIVGTSTGGILACALAYGLPIKQVMKLYREEGSKIFTNPMPANLMPAKLKEQIGIVRWLWRNKSRALNNNSHLATVLSSWFGDETLQSLYEKRKIALCIPAVKLIDEKARVFKTPHHFQRQMDNHYRLVDVCLATSAAPIFLPLVGLPSPQDPQQLDVFADGGLWANNPVLIGLIEALTMTNKEIPIQIISLGTCAAPEGSVLTTEELDRGMLTWRMGAKALSLSMNAQASGNSSMTDFLAGIFRDFGKPIEVFRIPQTSPSTDQIPYLKLDLADERALAAFSKLGSNDGTSAYRLMHDTACREGQILCDIFKSMQYLPQQSDEESREESIHA